MKYSKQYPDFMRKILYGYYIEKQIKTSFESFCKIPKYLI
jgi:hypothetical protein